MNTNTKPEEELLTFYSNRSIPYGTKIAILTEPEKQNDHWLAIVLDMTPQPVNITLDNGNINEKTFIIIRCAPVRDSSFLHRAIQYHWRYLIITRRRLRMRWPVCCAMVGD
jgi:hypothetical protein